MDFEYTLDHAGSDLQRIQAERDEEARLVFLAYDELDLILAQQSREAEEAIAARQTPRPPEVIPTAIALPQPVESHPPEVDTSTLPDPSPTQIEVPPPKIPRLRLTGENLKRHLAQKTQALLNEKVPQSQGVGSEKSEPASGSVTQNADATPMISEANERGRVRGEEPLNNGPFDPTATSFLPSLHGRSEATGNSASIPTAHPQHKGLSNHVAPVSSDAPFIAPIAARSTFDPRGVRPSPRGNYLEWSDGRPVAASHKANAPVHAPLGPKAMYGAPQDAMGGSPHRSFTAKPIKMTATAATFGVPAFGVSDFGPAGVPAGLATTQPTPSQWPPNATNSFKGHSKSFWQKGGFHPPQQTRELRQQYRQQSLRSQPDAPVAQPQTEKVPLQPQVEKEELSVTKLMNTISKVQTSSSAAPEGSERDPR